MYFRNLENMALESENFIRLHNMTSISLFSVLFRDTLHGAKVEAEKSKTYVTKTLQTYESLGSEFDDLVMEYQTLKEEMDNKEWALSELQKSAS